MNDIRKMLETFDLLLAPELWRILQCDFRQLKLENQSSYRASSTEFTNFVFVNVFCCKPTDNTHWVSFDEEQILLLLRRGLGVVGPQARHPLVEDPPGK